MMLPPFKIRHLRVAQIPSASGTGPSINWTQDAVVEIAAPEYDALVSRHPEASLSYFDEDDGELITVGTSLELSQRLDEPVRSDQVTLATTSTLSETAPAPTTSSPVLNGTEATMPPDMHSFDVLRPEHGLRAWKILEGKKRAKRYRDSVRHRLEAEPAVVGPAESSGLDFYAARGGPSTCSRIAPSGPDEVGFQTGSLTEEGKKQAIEAGMQLRSSLQPSLNGTSSPSEAERQIHQQRWAAYGRTVSCDDLRKHSGLPARDTNETAAHGDTSKSLLEAYEERVKQWSSTQQEAGIITGTESGNIVDSSVPISENRNLPEPLQLVARTLSTFASEIKRVIPEGQSQLPLPQHIPQVFEKLCRKAAKDFGTRIQTFAHAASEAQRFSEQAAEHTRQLDVEAFENSIRGICNVAVNVERYGREVLSGSTSTIFPSNGETSNDGNTTNGSVKSPDLDSSGTVAELATLQRASSPRQVGLSSDLQGDLQPACEEEVSADIETQNGIGGDENNYQQTRQTDSDPITAYDFRRRQLRRRSMRNNVVGDRRVLVGGGSPIQRPYARSSEELPYEYIVPGTRPSPMATSSRRGNELWSPSRLPRKHPRSRSPPLFRRTSPPSRLRRVRTVEPFEPSAYYASHKPRRLSHDLTQQRPADDMTSPERTSPRSSPFASVIDDSGIRSPSSSPGYVPTLRHRQSWHPVADSGRLNGLGEPTEQSWSTSDWGLRRPKSCSGMDRLQRPEHVWNDNFERESNTPRRPWDASEGRCMSWQARVPMSSDSLGPQWTSGYSGEHNQIGNDPGSALSAPRRAHESFSQETVNVPNSSFDLQSLPRLSGPAENTASANTSISQGTPLERPSRGASKTVRFEEPSTHLRRSLDKAPRARDDALAPHVSEEKGDTITEDGARKRPQQSLSDQQVTLLRATVEGMFQKLGVAGKLRLPEVSASESLPFDATPAATSGANLNAADIESVFQECYKQAQEKVSAPDRQDLSGQTTFAINSNDQRTPVTRPYPTPVTVGKVQNRDRVEEPASEPASQFGHSKSSSLWNAFPLSAATHTEGSSSKQHGEAGKLWADRPWEPTSGMAFGGYAPPSATRLGWDRYLDRYRKTPGSFPVMQSSMGVDPRVNQVFPANSNAHRVKSSPSTACPPGSSAVAATGAGVETSVSKCVRQLQEMGFDQPENGGVEWLSVYALEAGGDIDEALRIMEEDRKAHGLRPL